MPIKLIPTTPKKSLNAAFLKVRPLRSEIDTFKANLINLLDKIDEAEREENQKTHVRDFLVNTYYKGKNEFNTKGTIDLVIHTDGTNKSPVVVIIEAKRPSNKSEWISTDKPNGKALHELVLYYLRERIDENNINIKNIVLTNIYEWYIIDAAYFDKVFYQNKQLVKDYQAWRAGQKVTSDTALFYTGIVKPLIESLEEEIPCTYFDIRSYNKALRNTDIADDKQLIELQKLLSEFHLLKVPFANDSNKLDKRFYSELLHIIGLTEIKEGSKKLIGRHKEEDRMIGSILEDTILQLDSRDKLNRIKNASQYGNNKDEKLFNIALELTITWVNRILFLKLLEGQLLSYHKGDKAYLFLNHNMIREFDQLDALFFQVLAKRFNERNAHVGARFDHVPYLNSSLFEPTELEHDTLFISNLSDDKTIPIQAQTVLKGQNGAKRSGELSTLEYLFAFLDAYDFSGEGSEDIQEDNKPLINASVLGLIFEKINGYKDGSFFTPGFITMYMCRETIRKAVVQKFNETKGWDCESLDQLYDKIENRNEANTIINSIKICDPAVGSGHFLVSALNEMIAVKSDLKVLQDRDDKRLKEYHVEVVNDELIVRDEDGNPFKYNPHNKESQRVQEALFHEKQNIIERCLFGVDINPNSVKICRLRLWIELLKNAYYITHDFNRGLAELQTLPNIDINIKCGNSLVSRFAIDADIKDVLKNAKQWNIESYKMAVDGYRNAKSKDEKRELESLIEKIKGDFKSEVDRPFKKKISDARGKAEKYAIDITNLTAFGQQIDKKLLKDHEDAVVQLTKLESEREDITSNKIYENGFEWRFEFPEVLSDEGDFLGFDVVIGNPPYFAMSKIKEQGSYFENGGYYTYSKSADIYCLFYEKGIQLLKYKGILTFITSNSWLRTQYGAQLRTFLIEHANPLQLLNIEDTQVFEDATVESNIIEIEKSPYLRNIKAASLKSDFNLNQSLEKYFKKNSRLIQNLPQTGWTIGNEEESSLKAKLENQGVLLKNLNYQILRGFTTGFNDAFFISTDMKNNLVMADPKCESLIKPALRGKDITKFGFEWKNIWVLLIKQGLTKQLNTNNEDPEVFFSNHYPSLYKHLKEMGNSILGKGKGLYKRDDQGDHWWELRPCAYYNEFERPKIIWGELSDSQKFAYDESGFYSNNTIFFITGNDLKYLISILNSKVAKWYFNEISTSSGMGTNRWLKYKIELLPIKQPLVEDKLKIENLASEILEQKKQSLNADITELETQIDQLVYELYGLTEEEIRIVEGK